MEVKEIIAVEERHSEGDLEKVYSVYLYPSGSFYHAYEWSAWLLSRYAEKLKLRRERYADVNGDVCFVGFPVTSLAKYTPAGATQFIDESTGVVTLCISKLVRVQNTDIAAMRSDYAAWRESVPVTDRTKRDQASNGKAECISIPGSVQDRVLLFPLEQSTPLECMVFISELKQEMLRKMAADGKSKRDK